jgi:hypothetical protein
MPAGSQEELLIAQFAAITQEHAMHGSVHLAGDGSGEQIDLLGSIVPIIAEMDLVQALHSAQVTFGERWPLVGPVQLLGDQGDAAMRIQLTDPFAGCTPCQATPDDHVSESFHGSYPSLSSYAR